MPRLLVAVSFSIDPHLLQLINDTVNGKSQSEKIRRLLGLGFEVFTLQQQCVAESKKVKK
jgi:hypothetical protein